DEGTKQDPFGPTERRTADVEESETFRLRRSGCGLGLAFEDGDDRGHTVRNALVEIAGLELRRDDVPDDAASRPVAGRALEPVTHLDAQLPVLRCDHEQDAVVLALLSELPRPEDFDGVFLDGLVADRRHGEHRDLIARGLLMGLERRGDALAGRALENLGVV